ncbi:hypothetical protein [Streptomyces sp. NPDC001816]|uniref:hypothetical protein n=1 Tax=Streptomyces sp. NPDC001816 TaxID=3364612 RepID=UPI0036CB7B5B
MTAPQHDLRNPNDVNDLLVAAVIAKDSRAVQACGFVHFKQQRLSAGLGSS